MQAILAHCRTGLEALSQLQMMQVSPANSGALLRYLRMCESICRLRTEKGHQNCASRGRPAKRLKNLDPLASTAHCVTLNVFRHEGRHSSQLSRDHDRLRLWRGVSYAIDSQGYQNRYLCRLPSLFYRRAEVCRHGWTSRKICAPVR